MVRATNRWTRLVDVDVGLRVFGVEPGARSHPAFLKQHYDVAASSGYVGGTRSALAAFPAERTVRDHGLRASARSGFRSAVAGRAYGVVVRRDGTGDGLLFTHADSFVVYPGEAGTTRLVCYNGRAVPKRLRHLPWALSAVA